MAGRLPHPPPPAPPSATAQAWASPSASTSSPTSPYVCNACHRSNLYYYALLVPSVRGLGVALRRARLLRHAWPGRRCQRQGVQAPLCECLLNTPTITIFIHHIHCKIALEQHALLIVTHSASQLDMSTRKHSAI
uniref:Uncharacterized protein n=1 Tax=Arundo donax TaxID=35708 RepID=A0A0A8Z321_ARUDO